MSDGRFAILDPAAGISGDMLLGAIIAAGAPAAWLAGLPARLGFPDVRVDIQQVDRCGIQATKVNVVPAEQDSHVAHRCIAELIATVERSPLSPWVRDRVVRAFRLLGEAEGRVHGVAPDQVALHEVGAVDAIIDLVGAIEGFEQLGITQVFNRPVAVGSGWVRAAHGMLPVPAPATAILLDGVDQRPNGPVVGEATTPTGAVLLKVLSAGAPPARWRALASGAWGAGDRDPSEYPNALRLILAERAMEAGEVVVLSTDLDDLSPEYLSPLRDALVTAGAVDVQVWTTQMKKGRTGFRIEAVAPVGDAERVAVAFFRHSTSAGVRRQVMERITVARRVIQVEAKDGTNVRVKVLDTPDGPRVKPEFEDVVALARRTGQAAPEVARDLHDRAIRLVRSERKTRSLTPNKES